MVAHEVLFAVNKNCVVKYFYCKIYFTEAMVIYQSNLAVNIFDALIVLKHACELPEAMVNYEVLFTVNKNYA